MTKSNVIKTENAIPSEDVGEYVSPMLVNAEAGQQVVFPIPEALQQQADA